LAAPAPALELGGNLYESIGVTPLVNCRGTYTIITGSQTLPEVKRAMEAASHAYVHMDELMEAVGQRLAELTKAEWGIVTAGCAAALTHATSACISGGDPEKMQRVPNLAGLKNEVVVPRYSRNEYDHAVRMLGVKMVEVDTAAQFEAALSPQTAMVMILSCPAAEKGELSIENACAIARRKGVPVVVDAAAETLPTFTSPMAPTWWPTAAASACAVHRRPDCCWGRRTWSARHGSTARRITRSAAR
jgi:L-seryl-tRNA(Ser) seleniumtransferase